VVKKTTNNGEQIATVFRCAQDELVGVHHVGSSSCTLGVLFIVGGRQYRAGAHRQFTLLARELSQHGYPTFRFDVRGMGDSSGEPRHFLDLDTDIDSALQAFKEHSPQLESVLLWGLCDGASAAIVCASALPLVKGVVMVNPWISTDDSAAKVQLKHYYRYRLFSHQFWRKMLSGKVNLMASLVSFFATIGKMLSRSPNIAKATLPDIVFNAIERYSGKVYILISEHDITAREFEEEYSKINNSQKLSDKNTVLHRVIADHTFSTPEQHELLRTFTFKFTQSLQEHVS